MVTGATGFVGAHLVASLVDLRADVVVLKRDNLPETGITSRWAGRVRSVNGAVQDLPLVERVLAEYEVATVFHLAAQSQVGVANRSPLSTFDTNVGGTWNVLEAARRSTSVTEVVTASSDKAYGAQERQPYTEQMPLEPAHPYDVSKACADLISTSYARSFGTPVAITRCANIFGPGDLNWSRLIPGTIRSLVRGERPVIRSDGSLVRDYLFVNDAVGAYLLLAERLARDSFLSGQAFNFSLEQPLSVLEVVERLQRAVGTAVEPDIRANASNEIRSQALDASRAREILGWQPAAKLDEALAVTVQWYRRHVSP